MSEFYMNGSMDEPEVTEGFWSLLHEVVFGPRTPSAQAFKDADALVKQAEAELAARARLRATS